MATRLETQRPAVKGQVRLMRKDFRGYPTTGTPWANVPDVPVVPEGFTAQASAPAPEPEEEPKPKRKRRSKKS